MTNSVTRRSSIIRLGMWLLLACAAWAAVSLVFEWYHFTQSMPDRGWNLQVARILGLAFLNLVFTALLASIAILVLWVRLAGTLPDLQGWHLQIPDSEFCADDAKANYTLKDYLEQEDCVFRELDALITGPWAKQIVGAYSRYNVASVCNPETIVDRNWNRTSILKAPNPIGAHS